MRHSEPAAVFPAAKCAAQCGAPWSKWCRGCNLVWCQAHAEPTAHNCPRLDLRRGVAAPEAPVVNEKPSTQAQQELPFNGNGQAKKAD